MDKHPTPLKKSSDSGPHNDVIVKIDGHEKDKEVTNDGNMDNHSAFENIDLADNKRCSKESSSSDDYDTDEDEHRLQNQQRQVTEEATSFSLGRSKTQQSRLLDPPKSGSMRMENDDEDEYSLYDDDIPDDLKNNKADAITFIQWISFVLILTSLICTVRFPKWKRRWFHGLFMWQWELLILVLICGRLVSGWCVRIAVFFIERNFLLRKRLLYFVYGIRTPVQNCIWLCWVLIAWNAIFNETVAALHIPLLEVINKFMVCMLVTTSLWLIKTLIVKVLASTFHVNKFFDRIQDALFNQYVIETLSGPPLVEIHNNQLSMSEIAGGKGGGGGGSGRLHRNLGCSKKHEGITIDHLHRLNHDNISAWNMKRLMRIIRHGSLTTLDERLQGTYYDEPGTEIRSELEAKRAARSIFTNVTRRRSRLGQMAFVLSGKWQLPACRKWLYIYLDDLMRFLRKDEAVKTMSLLVASSEDERVDRTALNNWVVSVFRERKSLALTLNDTKTAVNKLHRMVNMLVAFVILIICLVILNIATTQVLVLISSQLVVVAFVFGNTCKTIFESIIFLFVMHPFDVGDRCEIGGVQMIVEEMNILNTIFLRADNQKIYYPNSTLATRSIGNFYRSPDMIDTINFLIHVGTPADKISLIKQRILSFVDSNKEHWYPSPNVLTMDMYDLNTQKLSVWVKHKINYQDLKERLTRRGKIIEEMNRIFKEVDLEYRTYPLDINIRSMPMPMPITPTRIPSTWTS
ncbi:putative mechanosensitive ion channel MscS, LSM domain superfamily [Helianthus annuus]|nr:putative mechanosensitive ion channel MscS, LSM domain superfamily [Helianthus annuus]